MYNDVIASELDKTLLSGLAGVFVFGPDSGGGLGGLLWGLFRWSFLIPASQTIVDVCLS